MKHNEQLTDLHYWLLPMLMNGQVTSASSAIAVGESEEKLSSSADHSRSMAAEENVEYKLLNSCV